MILLDTCAIIWDALAPKQLSPQAREAIARADEHQSLAISDISLWEFAMLVQKGRLQVQDSTAYLMNLFLASRNAAVTPISPEIAEMSVGFGAEMIKDPADRIIAATAIIHNASLVTADQNLIANPMLDTIW